ncbi:hypothetical protein K32_17160 [Kaistia sp. 32K]|uniref:lasso peptide biosynthesis B2 protein n=1 Tax=Kaistia sp. 32K TaxID=2795690 RepID=UPI00191507BB|nr:lasso peptide biosynthesis B2 protein [Kaistia sp. 32K]BCP53099.1 hypothetical protein K32_17160 [Kaistia sp. 32K]
MTPNLLLRAKFRAEMWFWAKTLPFRCRKSRDFSDILRIAHAGASRRYAGLRSAYIGTRAKKAGRRPWLMRDRRCLREGILAYRFLTLAGIPATIHFGVDRTSIGKAKLSAHCWVSAVGMPILNPPEPTMVTIFTEQNRAGPA